MLKKICFFCIAVAVLLFSCSCGENKSNVSEKVESGATKQRLILDGAIDPNLSTSDSKNSELSKNDASTINIMEINDLNEIAHKGKTYEFPKTVEVIMSNGTKKITPVIWDYKGVKMLGVDKYLYSGSVEGYDKKVLLALTFESSH